MTLGQQARELPTRFLQWLRPQGRMFVILGRSPVMEAVLVHNDANGPRIDSDARRALSLLAAGYVVTGNDITLDIGAHDGVLRIEGLPVRPLPPVY